MTMNPVEHAIKLIQDANVDGFAAYLKDHPEVVHQEFEINMGTRIISMMHYVSIFHKEHTIKFIEAMLEVGANINHPNFHGETPLHIAVRTMGLRTMFYLVEHGADINAQANSGRSILHEAVECEDDFATQYLIDRGADLNKTAIDDGDIARRVTPLRMILLDVSRRGYISERRTKVIMSLLSAGAHVEQEDIDLAEGEIKERVITLFGHQHLNSISHDVPLTKKRSSSPL